MGLPHECGTAYGNGCPKVATLEVLPHEFFFQGDWNRGKSSVDQSGQLDPSVSVMNTDVYPFNMSSDDSNTTGKRKFHGNKISADANSSIGPPSAGAVFGPAYKWDCQYLAETPPHVMEQFYAALVPATGRAIGETLAVHPASAPRELFAISKIPDGPAGLEMVMAGERSDIPVCPGMGVRFNGLTVFGVPQLGAAAGVVVSVCRSEGSLTVSLVVSRDQLPPPGNDWHRLDAPAAFQTNVQLKIRLSDVTGRVIAFPNSLWQFKQYDGAGGRAFDLQIVGHIDLSVADSSPAGCTQPANTPRTILQGLYGLGPLAWMVKWDVHRVETLDARRALKMAAADLPCLFGAFSNDYPYLDFMQQRILEFARNKANVSKTSTADNTLHLNFDPWVFVRVVHEFVDMDSCTVSRSNGVFYVTAPTWEAARMLLPQGQADGKFDLRKYGWGFVELFAPIVFKWEIYDTTRGRGDSRSPDGFIAITFSGYVERDRHGNEGGIKDTRPHPQTERQMYKRPSACPRY